MVTLGVAVGGGTIYKSLVDNNSAIEVLETEVRAQEIQDVQFGSELKKSQEFAELIQSQNEQDHQDILNAIRELSESR